MANKIVVAGSTVSASQLKDFFRQIDDGSLNGIHMQAILEHRDPFGFDSVMIDWAKAYGALRMGVRINNAEVNAPTHWTVPVMKGVTANKVMKALRDLGVNVYPYTEDLDTAVPENNRDPANGDYVVKFRKTIEADPELQGKSARVLITEGVKGITLLERLLLELGYFVTTGNHLDTENVTLCSGSRYSDGDVPDVYWSPGLRRVYVRWYFPSDSNPYLRARAVVS